MNCEFRNDCLVFTHENLELRRDDLGGSLSEDPEAMIHLVAPDGRRFKTNLGLHPEFVPAVKGWNEFYARKLAEERAAHEKWATAHPQPQYSSAMGRALAEQSARDREHVQREREDYEQ